jgi:hypothetical protein
MIFRTVSSLFPQMISQLPSWLAEAVMLFTCIREVSNSNLDWDADYHDPHFSQFPSGPKVGHGQFRPHPLQFIVHCHPNIRRYKLDVSDSAVAYTTHVPTTDKLLWSLSHWLLQKTHFCTSAYSKLFTLSALKIILILSSYKDPWLYRHSQAEWYSTTLFASITEDVHMKCIPFYCNTALKLKGIGIKTYLIRS